MKRLPIVFYLGIALVVAGLVSCEKTVEKVVEAPAAITVTTVNASADSVTQGQPVQLWTDLDLAEGVDAANLKYNWYADKGTFAVSTGDTAVWTAPGETGVVKVTVHVTDGENIAIGMKNVGVDMYTPTADVYYVGAEVCAQCHSNENHPEYTGWSQTGHADAWASLQTSGHVASYCEPCHSVNQDDTPGNSGYDEVPTAQFRDVQCESCHGPGSAHAESGDPTKVEVQPLAALDVQTCGVCHNGEHHPYLEEWQDSRHSHLVENSHAASNGGCQPCHSGTGFVEEYSSRESGLFNAENPMDLTCGACHDSHSAENPGQLRTVAAVDFVGGKTADTGGAGQLCMQCHQARHSAEEQVPAGDAHFGPHHSNQGDAVYGTSGSEGVNPSMTFASSGHGFIEDACARCHVFSTGFDELTQTANVGHTFEPRTEACAQCHGEIDSFDAIMAKKDYDNDGTVEGLQNEVDGLQHLLAETMVTWDNDNNGGQYFANADPNSADFVATVMDSVGATEGDTSAAAIKVREGGWNLVYEFEERSHGVHNPAYIVQLLQQSILYYDPTALPSDVVLRDNTATTFTAIAADVK